MKKKPTYKVPVSICAIVLFVGAIVLAILMETRQMAPPRKYEVDMSGEVIGIDNGPKIPVLTKEEVKDEEIKEEKKKDSPKPEAMRQRSLRSRRNLSSFLLTLMGSRSRLLKLLCQILRSLLSTR